MDQTQPSHAPSNETVIRGWVSSPNNRGTIDIIWASATTIFVCVWVMLHLNLPAKHESDMTVFVRRSKWFIIAMLAPELLMLFAGGQWAAARRSVEEMKSITGHEWTMTHAFYAESGGFVLQARESVEFPVTSHQIHRLVCEGFVDMPAISTKEISDRSKADGFAKVIAGAQSVWFAVQIAARGIQGLAVTLLELSTVCLMTCTAAALFFWFYKPLDVKTPTIISCDSTITEIILQADLTSKRPYKYTPLDFLDPLEYTSDQFPLHRLWGELKRPLPRIPNDRDTLLHSWRVLVVISIPTAAFGTLQLIAWNFSFPTRTEQLLWRFTCLGGGIVLGLGCVLEAAAIAASGYTVSGMQTYNQYKTRWPQCLLFYIAGALYFVGRMIVIVEVIISLRALPASCFETVQWTSVLPHV